VGIRFRARQIGLIRAVIKRRENTLNLALLLTLTFVDVALAQEPPRFGPPLAQPMLSAVQRRKTDT
jgi:hypothetical protein